MLGIFSFFFSNIKTFAIIGAVIAVLGLVTVEVNRIKEGALIQEQNRELRAELALEKAQAAVAASIDKEQQAALDDANKKIADQQKTLDAIIADSNKPVPVDPAPAPGVVIVPGAPAVCPPPVPAAPAVPASIAKRLKAL